MFEQLRVVEGGESRPVFDLDVLLDEMLAGHFPGISRPAIRWGRKIARKRRRSIRLGSYYRPTQTIRIHPLLGSAHVPRFFVQSIIFHELLHHVLGPAHDRRFHRHERTFRYHREANAWLRANLSLLLGLRARPRKVVAPPARPIVPPPAPSPLRQMTLF